GSQQAGEVREEPRRRPVRPPRPHGSPSKVADLPPGRGVGARGISPKFPSPLIGQNRAMKRTALALLAVLFGGLTLFAAPQSPEPISSDFVLHDFKFTTGETLPEVRIHYRTIGTLRQDGHGGAA